jgi:hypothetical protein
MSLKDIAKGILRVLSFTKKASDLIEVDLPGLAARFMFGEGDEYMPG